MLEAYGCLKSTQHLSDGLYALERKKLNLEKIDNLCQ